jgi:hypothetical protein
MRARFFEEASAKGSMTGPLVGIKDVPLVSVSEAIDCLEGGTQEELFAYMKKSNAIERALTEVVPVLASGKYPTMTTDEAVAIYLYTMPGAFHTALNDALRDENTALIGPLMKYIKLFLTALYKLPIEKHTVYRGAKLRDPSECEIDNILVWWTFSSTTRRVHVTDNFLNITGPRAKFIIESVPCVNIEELSYFPGEFERLLLPGTALKVLSVASESNDGYCDVQVQFIKGHVVFDFMHPEWPIDLFK